MLTSSKGGPESQSGEELGGRATAMSKLLLHPGRHGRILCALWSATVRPPRSRLQDLNMIIQGCQM